MHISLELIRGEVADVVNKLDMFTLTSIHKIFRDEIVVALVSRQQNFINLKDVYVVYFCT